MIHLVTGPLRCPARVHPLAELRIARGLTQSQLALLVGSDRSSVQRWEAGTSVPHPKTQRKLAKVFFSDPNAVQKLRLNP